MGTYSTALLEELRQRAKSVRRHIVTMVAAAGSGHPAGSLSATDLMVTLYFHQLRHRPEDPAWPDRDRFILSKGHCAPVLYATLAEAGYFSKDILLTLRRPDSPLQKGKARQW
uniref:Transketolase N-terminal domain-containing protein n=1 Tax=Thermorudis sp. TaxID=1969470 RepID=A0A7C2WEY7_9BACT